MIFKIVFKQGILYNEVHTLKMENKTLLNHIFLFKDIEQNGLFKAFFLNYD